MRFQNLMKVPTTLRAKYTDVVCMGCFASVGGTS